VAAHLQRRATLLFHPTNTPFGRNLGSYSDLLSLYRCVQRSRRLGSHSHQIRGPFMADASMADLQR